jgi:hypothetical protein
MAELSQTPEQPLNQLQQAGESPRAPQSAYEADAPRLERAAPKTAPRPITDWASI